MLKKKEKLLLIRYFSAVLNNLYVYSCVDIHSFPTPVKYARMKWTGPLDAQWPFTSLKVQLPFRHFIL